ncbi:MAG: hypothetical protein ACI90U_002273 [Pseudomonadales bacterium]|jgi:hypothetical protein
MKNLTINQLIAVAALTLVSTTSMALPLDIQLPTLSMPTLSMPTISMPEVIAEMTVDNVSFDSFWEAATEQLIADSSEGNDVSE